MIPLQYRRYNLPLDFPVIAFLGQQWKNPQEEIPFLHFHDCIEIGCCREGKGILVTGNGDFPYKKGDLCVIPPYMPHMMRSDSKEISNWEYVFFDPMKLWGEHGKVWMEHTRFFNSSNGFYPIFSKEELEGIGKLVEQIIQEFYEKPDYYPIYVRGCLMTLMAKLERTLPEVEEKGDHTYCQIITLFPAIQYISEHFGEEMEIAQLAELCHLSPTHFRRLFRQMMQTSPLDYLNRIRISKATQSLLYGDVSVGETAKMCGFFTLSSFHRAFQKYMGMSPTKWKQVYHKYADKNTIRSLDEMKNPLVFEWGFEKGANRY